MIDPGAIATGVATSIATQKASEALSNITKQGPDAQESILQVLLDIKDRLAPQEKQNYDYPMSLQPYPYEYMVDEAWMGKAHLCIFFFNETPLRFDIEGVGTYDVSIGPGWVQCDVRGRISTTDGTMHNVIVSYRDDALGSGLVGGGSGPSGNVTVTNFPATQPVDGTVNVGNFPATQPVSGNVGVTSLPVLPAGTNMIGNVHNVPIDQTGAYFQTAANPSYFIPTSGPSGPSQSFGTMGEAIQSSGGVTANSFSASSSVITRAGRLCRVLVTVAPSASITFYDSNNSTLTGKVIVGIIAANAAVGTIVDIQMPVAYGIYASFGGTGTITVGYD
jgi:hypothetical protein